MLERWQALKDYLVKEIATWKESERLCDADRGFVESKQCHKAKQVLLEMQKKMGQLEITNESEDN